MTPPAPEDEPRTRGARQSAPRTDILTSGASAGVAAVLVALLAALTVGAATGWAPLASLDHTVGRWAYDRTYGHQLPRQFWVTVTTVGQPWVLRLIILAAAAFHGWRRRWSIAGWLLATVVVELVVAPSAKFLLSRPRPYWQSPIIVVGGLGYPSGHAAAAAMFVTTMTLLVLFTVSLRRLKWVCIGAVVVIGALVPASRIFLGVHYLTDVVAGLLLGGAISLLTWCAFARHIPRAPYTEVR